jgi:hypothetical protein
MDSAWIGVIGVAIGAAIGFVGGPDCEIPLR